MVIEYTKEQFLESIESIRLVESDKTIYTYYIKFKKWVMRYPVETPSFYYYWINRKDPNNVFIEQKAFLSRHLQKEISKEEYDNIKNNEELFKDFYYEHVFSKSQVIYDHIYFSKGEIGEINYLASYRIDSEECINEIHDLERIKHRVHYNLRQW